MKTTAEQRSAWKRDLEASESFGLGRVASLALLADAERCERLEGALRAAIRIIDTECDSESVEEFMKAAKAALGETT